MLDIQFIRDNPDVVAEKAKQKGYAVDIKSILVLDQKRRTLALQVDELRHERRELANSTPGGKPSSQDIAKGQALKEKLGPLAQELETVQAQLLVKLHEVPNIPTDDVPVGATEADNKVAKTVGDHPTFDFKPKNHWEIGQKRDWIDKDRAAKVAGSRFAYLKGELVLLEFALWQFALNTLTDQHILKQIIDQTHLQVSDKPFVPVMPPAVAKTEVYEATGRLDKEEQTYKLADDNLWLNASAEHTLAPMYMGETLEEEDFPIRYLGYTTAFRREAGSYGKDVEGIVRLHQFNKLEMESFSLPEESLQEHLFMIAIQEYLMTQLKLPYQVVMKCTADIGKPNARGVDIDVWLPGQNKYRETHTADYMTDYQARRMQTRVKRKNGTIDYVHTNDATAFSERPLIGIIENFQQRDGTVLIPEVLQPYMQSKKSI